jgi:hypothetical protein
MALVVAVVVVDRLMMAGLLVSMGKAQVAQGEHLHFIQQGLVLLALLTEARVEKAVVLPQLVVVLVLAQCVLFGPDALVHIPQPVLDHLKFF